MKTKQRYKFELTVITNEEAVYNKADVKMLINTLIKIKTELHEFGDEDGLFFKCPKEHPAYTIDKALARWEGE